MTTYKSIGLPHPMIPLIEREAKARGMSFAALVRAIVVQGLGDRYREVAVQLNKQSQLTESQVEAMDRFGRDIKALFELAKKCPLDKLSQAEVDRLIELELQGSEKKQ